MESKTNTSIYTILDEITDCCKFTFQFPAQAVKPGMSRLAFSSMTASLAKTFDFSQLSFPILKVELKLMLFFFFTSLLRKYYESIHN